MINDLDRKYKQYFAEKSLFFIFSVNSAKTDKNREPGRAQIRPGRARTRPNLNFFIFLIINPIQIKIGRIWPVSGLRKTDSLKGLITTTYFFTPLFADVHLINTG